VVEDSKLSTSAPMLIQSGDVATVQTPNRQHTLPTTADQPPRAICYRILDYSAYGIHFL